MQLKDIGTKKIQYQSSDLWDMSAFYRKNWQKYISPVALGIMLSGFPFYFLDSFGPEFVGLIYGLLLVCVTLHLYKFTQLFYYVKRQGNQVTISFGKESVKVARSNSHTTTIPYTSFKFFTKGKQTIVMSTGVVGLILPLRYYKDDEIKELTELARGRLAGVDGLSWSRYVVTVLISFVLVLVMTVGGIIAFVMIRDAIRFLNR